MSDRDGDHTENEAESTTEPAWDDAPVALSLISEIVESHPDWRATTHHTPQGRKAMMIDFPDDRGEFESGLPGEFVSMISRYEEDSNDG